MIQIKFFLIDLEKINLKNQTRVDRYSEGVVACFCFEGIEKIGSRGKPKLKANPFNRHGFNFPFV